MVKVKLIIGLGNPDKKYEKTYHNAGSLFVEYLAQKGQSILKLLKSKVFMNESGGFVAKTIKKYGLKPKEILIAHDDSDIELGKYKFSFGRGSAGHNGAKSVIDSLGTKNFWRLRIGIGKVSQATKKRVGLPDEAHKVKAGDFVLKKINKEDLKILFNVFEQIAEHLKYAQ